MPTDLKLNSSPRRDTKDYVTNGDLVVGVVWLAFYLAILVGTITSPILSKTIELAAQYE